MRTKNFQQRKFWNMQCAIVQAINRCMCVCASRRGWLEPERRLRGAVLCAGLRGCIRDCSTCAETAECTALNIQSPVQSDLASFSTPVQSDRSEYCQWRWSNRRLVLHTRENQVVNPKSDRAHQVWLRKHVERRSRRLGQWAIFNVATNAGGFRHGERAHGGQAD